MQAIIKRKMKTLPKPVSLGPSAELVMSAMGFERAFRVCLKKGRNILEDADDVLRRSLVALRLGRFGDLGKDVFSRILAVGDGEDVDFVGFTVEADVIH